MEKTTQVQIVMASHVNGIGRLFGGQLMAWIDVVGAVAARRFVGSDVTTVSVDTLDFLAPAHVGDTVVMDACVTWAGSTSVEVRVDTFVEHMGGERVGVNRAYLVYVAIDDKEQPRKVPCYSPQTEEEQSEWEAAKNRRRMRLERAGGTK